MATKKRISIILGLVIIFCFSACNQAGGQGNGWFNPPGSTTIQIYSENQKFVLSGQNKEALVIAAEKMGTPTKRNTDLDELHVKELLLGTTDLLFFSDNNMSVLFVDRVSRKAYFYQTFDKGRFSMFDYVYDVPQDFLTSLDGILSNISPSDNQDTNQKIKEYLSEN